MPSSSYLYIKSEEVPPLADENATLSWAPLHACNLTIGFPNDKWRAFSLIKKTKFPLSRSSLPFSSFRRLCSSSSAFPPLPLRSSARLPWLSRRLNPLCPAAGNAKTKTARLRE
ncbi:hypothetical protein AAC387_Pa10g0731 [Persea americana]